MIKVVIADDHAIIRKGLHEMIREQADMQVVGEAEDGPQALEVVGRLDCDVLILDISLPHLNGLQVLEIMHTHHPRVRVLVLSVYPEEQFGIRMLKAGASGYLNKSTAPEDMIAAIRTVMNGGKYISPTLAERIAFGASGTIIQAPHQLLSEREYDVMRMLGAGKPPNVIAQELSLSPKTVSTYRRRVMEKLELKSNAELIRYVLANNLT